MMPYVLESDPRKTTGRPAASAETYAPVLLVAIIGPRLAAVRPGDGVPVAAAVGVCGDGGTATCALAVDPDASNETATANDAYNDFIDATSREGRDTRRRHERYPPAVE